MFPYFHPTSLLLVDDDPSFLDSLKFYFEDQFPSIAFQRPSEALSYLRGLDPKTWISEHHMAPAKGAIDPFDFEPGDRVIQLRASQLVNVFADRNRFAKPTVAIVDYAMPAMTGIEFLTQTKDLPIRRLLLTGKADEKTAIQAFNAGVIDAFVMKHEPDLPQTLGQRLLGLQKQYFNTATAMLRHAMSMEETEFIDDPAFDAAFAAIATQHGIIEYCVLTQPPGILGLQAGGSPVFVYVVLDDQIRAAREIANLENAPADLRTLLVRDDVLSLFPTRNGFYSERLADDWRSYVWPGNYVAGRRRWWYTVITDPKLFGIRLDSVFSFEQFLASV